MTFKSTMYLAVRGGYGKYTLGLFHERGPKTSFTRLKIFLWSDNH